MAANLDQLYNSYRLGTCNLDDLLRAIRRKAVSILRDDDAAQDFIVNLWQILPDLEIESSFSAYLHVKLRWASVDAVRRSQVRGREQQVPDFHDEEGNALSDTESLDVLPYRHLVSEGADIETDTSLIEDPVIRQIADLLMQGFSQSEIATRLGMSTAAVKMRLLRHRAKVSA